MRSYDLTSLPVTLTGVLLGGILVVWGYFWGSSDREAMITIGSIAMCGGVLNMALARRNSSGNGDSDHSDRSLS